MAYDKITYDLKDGIATIQFDDPKTLNAAGIDTVSELLHALEVAADEARCTIITGSGRGFCSGANLSAGPADLSHPDMKFDAGRSLDTHYNPLIQSMREHPHPIITAINGAAAGVGCSIALMGDLVLCAKSGYFLQAFRRIGLVPDGGSTYLLAKTIGRAKAMEMALFGEKVYGEQAYDWGLVNRVVEDDALMDTANEMARKLADGPTIALGLTRELIWTATDGTLDDALRAERIHQRTAGRTSDSKEGIFAFLQKRKAEFTGS